MIGIIRAVLSLICRYLANLANGFSIYTEAGVQTICHLNGRATAGYHDKPRYDAAHVAPRGAY